LPVQDPDNTFESPVAFGVRKGLGVNTAPYAWAENDFDFLFEMPTPVQLSNKSDNTAIFNELELALWQQLANYTNLISASGMRVLSAMAHDKPVLNFDSHSSLFPWLPWRDRKMFFEATSRWVSLMEHFDLSRPLAGQRAENLSIGLGVIRVVPKEVAVIMYEGGGAISTSLRDSKNLGFELASFELISLEFVEGSLFPNARVRRKILAGVMALLGIGFIDTQITKGISEREKTHAIQVEVEKTTKDQPALLYCGARISYDELRKNTERSFDYNEKGISADERTCRIAEEQTTMAIALHTDLPIDGKLGPQTLAHEKQFGKINHVPGTNHSPFFRGALSQVYKPPPEK
jgi:hypothetical protein